MQNCELNAALKFPSPEGCRQSRRGGKEKVYHMKKRLLILIIIVAFAMSLSAGCAGNKQEVLTTEGKRTDSPAANASSDDPKQNGADPVDASDEDSDKDVTPDEPTPESTDPAPGSAYDPADDNGSEKPAEKPTERPSEKPTEKPAEKPTDKPTVSPDISPAGQLKAEPPSLISGEYFGSGSDAKFSLSIIIPASAFEFQGSYHGSGEVELEVSYRDVGGAWIEWDEQKVNLWNVDQTTSALSFLYPAAYMIPRTEFRVRLTYRYTDDSGEHITSSAWSQSANTIPDAPEPDGADVFVGLWHSMNMLAAGWDERYAFHADGTYIYAASQINLSGSLIYMFGSWDVYEGALVLFPERDLSLEGAKIIHNENVGDYYEGGSPILTVYEYAERSLCSIERGGIDPASGRATIKINGHSWYNFDEHDEYSSFFSEYDHYMGVN